MPDLRQTRKNLTTALAIMGAVDLLAAIVYFSPLVGSAENRRIDAARAHPRDPTWRVAATLYVTTGDSRYSWLHGTLALWEGEFNEDTHHARYTAFLQPAAPAVWIRIVTMTAVRKYSTKAMARKWAAKRR